MTDGGGVDGGTGAVAGLALRRPAHRVDPRAVVWWRLRSAAVTLAVGVPQLVALALLAPLGIAVSLLTTTVVATAVVGALHLLVVPRLRFRVHSWEVTGDAVHTLEGWLRREWRIAPIARVQTVDTDQGPLQRVLRLSTVTVTTASSGGAVTIAGLDADVARGLAHDLTAAAQSVGGDGT